MSVSKPSLSLLLLSAAFLGTLGIGLAAEPAEGTLEITYAFAAAEGIEPSYQIAIWLEKENGEFVKTLFISEYLAYGGFNDPTICPAWTKVAGWDKATEAEYDAVSKPTPPIGSHTLKVDCKQRGIEPGDYVYAVQAHIIENFNISYRGKLTIGGVESENTAEVSYTPAKHEKADKIIHSVSAKYLPAGGSVVQERKP